MNPLGRKLLAPPTLRATRPPKDLRKNMGQKAPFVFWSLSQAILSDPHYESSLYGAMNAYLTAIFPLDRYFMVKPQGMIRPIADNGESRDDADSSTIVENLNVHDFSFGSFGGLHAPRGSDVEIGKDYVDFVVVKVDAIIADNKNHIPLVLVELKRDFKDSILRDATRQMVDYMTDMSRQLNCSEDLIGYLVMGDQAAKFWLSRRVEGGYDVEFDDRFSVLDSPDKMTEDLLSIASENW